MSDIRISDLPAGYPDQADYIPVDKETTRKVTVVDVCNVGAPIATKAEAEAGVDGTKRMTPKTTADAIIARGSSVFATASQGSKADTAVQPGDLGDLAAKDKVEIADIDATGSASSSTVLHGDGSWRTAGGIGDMLAANNLSELTDVSNARANLGLGTSATQASTAFATSAQGLLASSAVQPADLGALAVKDKVAIADIDATGTASSTTVLYGDGQWKAAGGGGDLLAANNLSDLSNVATARSNLGLGTLATKNKASVYDIDATETPGTGNVLRGDGRWSAVQDIGGLRAEWNLNDLTNKPGARANLGLGILAEKNAVAISDISATGIASNIRFLRGDGYWATLAETGSLMQGQNLADVPNKPGALANIGALPASGGTMTGFLTLNVPEGPALEIKRSPNANPAWRLRLSNPSNLHLQKINESDPDDIVSVISMEYATGDVGFSNDVYVNGTLAKAAGTFLIDHPLDPDNKRLAHGFVESPRYDLIYRGVASLIDGTAEVDIDSDSSMTEGTFEALTTNAIVTSLQNQSGYTRVKPGPIVGGKFTIISEDENANDEISWVVMAERNDAFVRSARDNNTDSEGRFITERNK